MQAINCAYCQCTFLASDTYWLFESLNLVYATRKMIIAISGPSSLWSFSNFSHIPCEFTLDSSRKQISTQRFQRCKHGGWGTWWWAFLSQGSRTRNGNRGAELIESWSPAKVLSTVVVVVRVPDFCDKPGQSRGKLPNLLLILCSEFLVVTFIVFRKVLMMQILWAQRWEGNVNN